MLQAELAARDVAWIHWVEQAIDQLWVLRAERARQGAQALKALGKIGLGVANVIRCCALLSMEMMVPLSVTMWVGDEETK